MPSDQKETQKHKTEAILQQIKTLKMVHIKKTLKNRILVELSLGK